MEENDPVKFSERTARRYLHKLHFSMTNYTKCLYYDGHERADVVAYRRAFVDRYIAQRRFFTIYEGKECSIVVEPTLGNEKETPRKLHRSL